MKFTESVRSFQVPATSRTSAWPPSLPSVPTSRATRVTSAANERSWSTIVLTVSFSSRNLALHIDGDLLGQVALGHGLGHVGDVAHLVGQVAGHRVHGVGQVLPGAGHAFHLGLPAELALGADLAGHARHFRGERPQLIDHRVDGVLQLQHFALHVGGDLLRQVAVGDGRRHLGDVADLAGEVAGHEVHASRSGPSRCRPRPSTLACPPSLPSVPTSRATRVTSSANEPQLVHHRVDGVLQLQHFALHVDGDLLGQVALGHGLGHVRRCCAPGR